MHAVLGMTELARPMIDLDLADAITARRRQHWDEAMQLAVKPHFLEYVGAIDFHAAVVIVQPHAGQPTDHSVENAARADLVPGIMADAFPTADHVIFAGPPFIGMFVVAVIQGRQKPRNLSG